MTPIFSSMCSGDILTCDASLCRKLTLDEISNYSKYFCPNFPNIFDTNRFLKGNQPQYLQLPPPNNGDVKEAVIINSIPPSIQEDSETSTFNKVESDNNTNKNVTPLTVQYPIEVDEIRDITSRTSKKCAKVKQNKVKSVKKSKVNFNDKVKVRQYITKWGKKYKDWFSDLKDIRSDVTVNFLMANLIPHDVSLKEMVLTKDRDNFILSLESFH